MSMKSIPKTYRFSAGLYSLIASEAERLKTTEADVVRLALRTYFDERQRRDLLNDVEERVISRLDSQAQRIATMLQHVISLAQPAGGKNHGR